MRAEIGDWLFVKSRGHGPSDRRALILKVGAGGRAPFAVRWTDDDREALMYPGPEAYVVSAVELADRNRKQSERVASVQSEITGSYR